MMIILVAHKKVQYFKWNINNKYITNKHFY